MKLATETHWVGSLTAERNRGLPEAVVKQWKERLKADV